MEDHNDQNTVSLNDNVNKVQEDLEDNIEEQQLQAENDLKGTLKKVESVVEMTMSGIDLQTVRESWKEGLTVTRDLDFE